ncbi:head-tail adaptor protein [Marinovum sp. 2_MG-2023]|uniref:head-tail adaptor protein n=2 Tax=Bacteria TaxID=2 RepID=UPI001FD40A78|nr:MULTISPECIES: head-tail adaptor protein [Roseobacteraceae]MCJ7873745.1 head-tail adaptor protein [Phaeobacter sp. J2-8]MDO6731020.1 head-tail adaptor protein [Marinovum sp. 2_MG-2023]MDO6778517.1 head-tail adaptor protein [Marinovum sp. 1_MG-2023]
MSTPRLNRALVLETAQDVPDGAGGFDRMWMPQGTIWADVSARSGRATRGAAAPVSVTAYRMIVRAAPMGDPARPAAGQRFREGPRVWRIEAVAERDPGARHLICFTEEELTP